MNKRHLHHVWVKLRRLSQWQFLILAIIFAVIAAVSLRSNNLTALKLRDNVLQVDKENGNTEAALKKLRQFVYSHMNTDLAGSSSVYPPIQLKYRYDRLVAAQKVNAGQTNTTIYNDAQKHCEALLPTGVSLNRVSCIQQYLDSHPLASDSAPIPDSLYKFDFVSPRWSPDLAGWSLLAACFFSLMFVVRFVVERWLRYEFKQHL